MSPPAGRPARLSRRALLEAGALAGAAALLGACGGEERPPGPADDARVLADLLAHERATIAALASLGGARADRLLAHDRRHAAALESALRRRGARPAAAGAGGEEDAAAATAGDGLVALALARKQAVLAAYAEALPRLGDGGLRAEVVRTAAVEAEHAAVLRTMHGEDAVPDAFAGLVYSPAAPPPGDPTGASRRPGEAEASRPTAAAAPRGGVADVDGRLVRERVLWHFDEARTDTALVRAAVWLEQLAALCYATAGDALDGDARRLAARFGAHEGEHAAALESVLQGFTVQVRNRPVVSDAAWHLPGLGSGATTTTLALLAELEAWLLAGYQEMARRTTERTVLRTVGTIVAGGAQHLAALRAALGRPPAPRAFERAA